MKFRFGHMKLFAQYMFNFKWLVFFEITKMYIMDSLFNVVCYLFSQNVTFKWFILFSAIDTHVIILIPTSKVLKFLVVWKISSKILFRISKTILIKLYNL